MVKYSIVDRKSTKQALAAMVTRVGVLSRLAAHWEPDLFGEDNAARLIGGWAVDFYQKYGEAPGLAIQQMFEEWNEADPDKDEVKLVERHLNAASDESERLPNSDSYLLDQLANYFNRVAAERAVEAARLELQQGRLQAAERLLEGRRRVELGGRATLKIGDERAAPTWAAAIEGDDLEQLIRWPRAMGRFFSDSFARDSFIAFIGSSGRSKSWWLLETVYQAVKQRRKVAYFEAGDLSEAQVLRRMGQRVLRRPLLGREVSIPVSFGEEEEPPNFRHEQRPGVTAHEARAAWHKLSWKRDLLRLQCWPNSSVSAAMIHAQLQEWERSESWVPDIIAIDYADILAPPPGYNTNPRDAINATWQRMRRMSQEFHAAVVTVTQADAGSYTTGLLRRSNFTDDRRKLDHLTSYYGINQTVEELDWGVQRLNCMKQRNMEYSETRCCYVAGCLSIGRPAIITRF